MITSQKALEIILNNTEDFGVEEVPFLESLGRILKEDIKADRDFPPFNRVSMDGIAISYDVFAKDQRGFKIENIQAAGSEQLTLKENTNCIEVMTGAVLPHNTDTVIPYELVTIENGIATINTNTVNNGQNIHQQGKDQKTNDVLIKKNKIISAAEIGVLATVGKSMLKVAKQPKVLIISTGDELVEVTEQPKPYQIRKSNVYTLVSLLEKLNIKADTKHITDDKAVLKQKIEQFLIDCDVLLFSGAVSKGKFDYLPEVLDELGVEKKFHKVKQRPGKPFWYGVFDPLRMNECHSERLKRSEESHTVVFAFPGNPVSTFVGCVKYFYPWYKKSVELVYENHQKAILAEDFTFKPDLTYFLQVRLENKKGLLIAVPIKGNGSGDLTNLANADAFLELPSDQTDFKTGEAFPLITYR
ncbi:MAG: molybdopterin molybdotransferase MoeA [Flavobacteriaceae bacterium]|nr:molybdopterin molybdotransferase MoeA [Flavobacteriaceae bacterium]